MKSFFDRFGKISVQTRGEFNMVHVICFRWLNVEDEAKLSCNYFSARSALYAIEIRIRKLEGGHDLFGDPL